MKYTITLAAIVAIATAQGISDLPSCSLSCILTGVTATGCSTTDFACSCGKADVLTPVVTPCIQEECSTEDQAKVISTLEGICASAGVPITIPTPGEVTSAAPAPEPTTEAPAPEPTTEAPAPEPTTEAPAPEPTVETSAAPVPSITDIVVSSALPLSTGACVAVTVTVTETSEVPTVPVSTALYPTGTGAPIPVPSGTGVYSSGLPAFTGAAVAVKVPAGIAGVLRLVAYLL